MSLKLWSSHNAPSGKSWWIPDPYTLGSCKWGPLEGLFSEIFPEARPGCRVCKNNRCPLKQGIFLSGTGYQLWIYIYTELLVLFLAAVVGMASTRSVLVSYFSPLSGDTGGGGAGLAQGLWAGHGQLAQAVELQLSNVTQSLTAAVQML